MPGACAVAIKGEGWVTEAPVTAAEETRSGTRARTEGAAGRVQSGPAGTDDSRRPTGRARRRQKQQRRPRCLGLRGEVRRTETASPGSVKGARRQRWAGAWRPGPGEAPAESPAGAALRLPGRPRPRFPPSPLDSAGKALPWPRRLSSPAPRGAPACADNFTTPLPGRPPARPPRVERSRAPPGLPPLRRLLRGGGLCGGAPGEEAASFGPLAARSVPRRHYRSSRPRRSAALGAAGGPVQVPPRCLAWPCAEGLRVAGRSQAEAGGRAAQPSGSPWGACWAALKEAPERPRGLGGMGGCLSSQAV